MKTKQFFARLERCLLNAVYYCKNAEIKWNDIHLFQYAIICS